MQPDVYFLILGNSLNLAYQTIYEELWKTRTEALFLQKVPMQGDCFYLGGSTLHECL